MRRLRNRDVLIKVLSPSHYDVGRDDVRETKRRVKGIVKEKANRRFIYILSASLRRLHLKRIVCATGIRSLSRLTPIGESWREVKHDED